MITSKCQYVRDMNVTLPGLYPVSINRWTVALYCSRCIVIVFTSLSHLHLLTSRRYQCNINAMNIHSWLWNKNVNNLSTCHHYLHSFVFHISLFIFVYWNDEGTPSTPFVWGSLLYPKGDNVSKDEVLLSLTIVLFCSWCISSKSKDQHIWPKRYRYVATMRVIYNVVIACVPN
jgi:hypothetical protein